MSDNGTRRVTIGGPVRQSMATGTPIGTRQRESRRVSTTSHPVTPVRQTSNTSVSAPSSAGSRRSRNRRRLSLRDGASRRSSFGLRSAGDIQSGRRLSDRRHSWVSDPNEPTKRYSATGDLRFLVRLLYKEKEQERAERRKSSLNTASSTNPRTSVVRISSDRNSTMTPMRQITNVFFKDQNGRGDGGSASKKVKSSSRLSLSTSLPEEIMENIAIPQGVIREGGDFSNRFDESDEDNENETYGVDDFGAADYYDDQEIPEQDREEEDQERENDDFEDNDNEFEGDDTTYGDFSLIEGARDNQIFKRHLNKRKVSFAPDTLGEERRKAKRVKPSDMVALKFIKNSINFILPKNLRKHLSKEAIEMLQNLTLQFVKQQADDLEAYRKHEGHRKYITAADALLLMRRAKIEPEDDLLNFSIDDLMSDPYGETKIDSSESGIDPAEEDPDSNDPSESLESKVFSLAQQIYNLEDIVKVESSLNIPKLAKKTLRGKRIPESSDEDEYDAEEATETGIDDNSIEDEEDEEDEREDEDVDEDEDADADADEDSDDYGY